MIHYNRLKTDTTFVLATDWGVSYTTGTDIDGAVLNVHKLTDEPNDFGGVGRIVKHEFDGLKFTSVEDAQTFALNAGLLKEYVPAPRPADADAEFWRKLWATRESIQRANSRSAGSWNWDD